MNRNFFRYCCFSDFDCHTQEVLGDGGLQNMQWSQSVVISLFVFLIEHLRQYINILNDILALIWVVDHN